MSIIENNLDEGIAQGTPWWHSKRHGHIGATATHTLLVNGKGARTYEQRKAKERTTDFIEVKGFENEHTSRGHRLEDVARQEINDELDYNFREVALIEYDDYISFSPDGLDGDHTDFECKALVATNHNKLVKVGVAKYKAGEYLEQCLFRLAYSRATKCVFVGICEDVQVVKSKNGGYEEVHPVIRKHVEIFYQDEWTEKIEEIREAVDRTIVNIKELEIECKAEQLLEKRRIEQVQTAELKMQMNDETLPW